MSPAACESETDPGTDAQSALESRSEPALCFAHLSDAARRARASHPAYAGRFPGRLGEPPRSA